LYGFWFAAEAIFCFFGYCRKKQQPEWTGTGRAGGFAVAAFKMERLKRRNPL
jgi:hypothetical protein